MLLGHSLGGLLTIRLLQEHPSLVSAGIALSPAIEIGPKYDTPCKRFIAYLLVDVSKCSLLNFHCKLFHETKTSDSIEAH